MFFKHDILPYMGHEYILYLCVNQILYMRHDFRVRSCLNPILIARVINTYFILKHF